MARGRRGRYLLAAAALPLLVVAAPTPSRAVTGGADDPSGHSYVVAIIDPVHLRPVCSGVWVQAPNGRTVVLTDAHCVSSTPGAGLYVWFGSSYPSSGQRFFGRSYRDPLYDASTHLHDLAFIYVSHPPAVAPTQLAPIGSATSYGWLLTVGYGQPYPGVRRSAGEQVVRYTGSWMILQYGSGNSCSGDSGGPDLSSKTLMVEALTDQGSCTYDEDTRVDTVEAHDFVAGQ